MFGAVFILGDVLSGIQIASIATIIIGVILLSTKFSAFTTRKKLVAAGVGSVALSMLFLGCRGIFAGAYTAIVGFALLSIMWRNVSSGLGFVTALITGDGIGLPARKQIVLPLVAAGITDAFGMDPLSCSPYL